MGSLNKIEDFLKFTMEVGEDFQDQWLPTLDTKLLVNGSNQVLYSFFEKPTNSNITAQKRTAMGEDSKVQVVSNDPVRRLLNNSEELGGATKVKIVDEYTQKLVNSGYRGKQLRKIISNGIKGYEGKRRRAIRDGRNLHRTSVNSQGARISQKLQAKMAWLKKTRRGEPQEAHGSKSKGREPVSKWGSVRSTMHCNGA